MRVWWCGDLNEVRVFSFQHLCCIRIEARNSMLPTKCFYSLRKNIDRCDHLYPLFQLLERLDM